MSNEDCGTIVCPLCAKPGTVRKFANGKRKGQFYIQAQCHGLFMNYGQSFQNWILDYIATRDAQGTLPPPPEVIPEPVPAPPADSPHVPEPKPLRSSCFLLFDY